MSERFNGKTIKQDANGNWPTGFRTNVPEAGRASPYFTGDSKMPKKYQAGEFRKTTWWGGNELERKPYTGNTDGTRFQTAANETGHAARETNASASIPEPYQTGNFHTTGAREGSAANIAKPSDAETDARRRVFQQPEVTDFREQRKMDIKATRSILGRE